MIYAHSLENTAADEWELLSDHLSAVARKSAENAAAFDASSLGEVAGLLHDLGKIKPAFQAKLKGEKNSVGHSGEGACYAAENFGVFGKMLAYCIAGHHAGLANGLLTGSDRPVTPLNERLKQAELLKKPEWLTLAPLRLPKLFEELDSQNSLFEIQFFIRMLFSALVDADFIQTEAFYSPEVERGYKGTLENLNQHLKQKLAEFPPVQDGDVVNGLRAQVLAAALKRAKDQPGLFSLTVPTGGGKTLSSLQFAIEHAVQHKKRRVIYVAPYTSIIEQTSDVFRSFLGDTDAILEHHSAFDSDTIEDESKAEKIKNAAQNWDSPIIVTTAVQLFESLYANRPSKCRKLHNIADSVIILDEAQNLPVHLLRPCLAALKELVRGYGCSLVLCTATQPAIYKECGFSAAEALSQENTREIAPNPPELFNRLKRVQAKFVGLQTNRQLVAQLSGKTALIIVNNKKQARDLYNALQDEGVFHLSTNMSATHRRHVLDQVKQQLNKRPTLLIATALVEAGVDLDFPEVWRAVAGLDSIAQAAGRCNREGKLASGQLHIFEAEETYGAPPEIKLNAEKALTILTQFDDPLSLEAVEAYFREIYWSRSTAMDQGGTLIEIADAGSELNFNFAKMAATVRLIEDTSKPLIIGGGTYGLTEEARELLKHCQHAGVIARKMQNYSIQVSPWVLSGLIASGDAKICRPNDFGAQFVILENSTLYSEQAGFSEEKQGEMDIFYRKAT